MKELSLFLLLIIMPLLASAQQTLDPKFEKKIEGLIDHSVPVISCERLEQKMNTPNLYLLDAREKKEYETSHLKDAVWVGYNTFTAKNLAAVPKDGIVVVYCSVGYRSEKIGEQLKKLGYARVYNLYGGIFEWTNRTYPIVDQKNKRTSKVHAYDQDWGRWLNKGEKVYK
jgi:rhodanese-related sulfurtransferase